MSEKVILAYSGGLDTSVAVRWIKEKYNLDVIAVSIDIGNVDNLEGIRQKALKLGAIKSLVIDAKEKFVNSFVFPSLRADALYESQYPLHTALGRPLIAQLLVEEAKKEGISIIAHGCTGKGNDQVRLDVSITALAPEFNIIAPAREWNMTRQETIGYAQKHNIPIPITIDNPYSIDENLWGRAIECGILENPWNEPPSNAFAWTKEIENTPEKATYLEIGFEKGTPISINNETIDSISLIQRINKIAGENGVGRIDHIEDRLIGIKSREVYEAPAAVVLLKAHQALEGLVLTKEQLRFKARVADEYADLVYNALWFSGIRQDLDAYIQSSQRYVSGMIRVKLHRGNCQIVGRQSPYSLYNYSLATYDKEDMFDKSASLGFIHIWGLPVKTQSQSQSLFNDN
jgi:argininosuccinate synthase